jgi:hypothetical protein
VATADQSVVKADPSVAAASPVHVLVVTHHAPLGPIPRKAELNVVRPAPEAVLDLADR